MYGLEYALFFGVPKNKVELIDGKGHWSFPFASRDAAEAHFRDWVETLCRWKQAGAPAVNKSAPSWCADVAGIHIELFPRPIVLEIPCAWEAFDAFLDTFNRRDFWPGQPAGLETGWDSIFDDGDIRMNLWSTFRDLAKEHGGKVGGRTDIALSDSASVGPDLCYFGPKRKDYMLADYFGAPPDMICEVLSAPSRSLDRGQRMDLYRRSGVGVLLLVEPARETVEVYTLGQKYVCQGTYAAGEFFWLSLFPGSPISVDKLFATQSKRHSDGSAQPDEVELIPEWLLPPEFKVGLEYFFHLGHPERRWEFWGNKAHSVLAFGSAAEARSRLEHFATEACRWEGMPPQAMRPLDADAEMAEIGRFQFTRQDRVVWLHVTVNGRLYKELLRTWCDRGAWDWGD